MSIRCTVGLIGGLLSMLVSGVEIQPSRFVTLEEMEAQVVTLGSRLAIGQREVDPFGQFQDADAVAQRPVAPRPAKPAGMEQHLDFNRVIQRIRIHAILPGEGFIIGNRQMFLGDRFPIQFRGQNIPVEIIEVRGDRVSFLNLGTKEVGVLPLGVMPEGLQDR